MGVNERILTAGILHFQHDSSERENSKQQRMAPSALTVIRTAFLELDEVNLGSLVPDATEPGTDFWPLKPPAFSKDQISKRTIQNIRETLDKKKYASLRAKLTRFFSSKLASEATSFAELIAPTSSLYYIKHPKVHFKALCEDDDTRSWIEDTMKHFPIFLIIGLLTVTHVEVEHRQQGRREFEAAAELSVTDMVSPGASAVTDALNVGVNITASNQTHASTTFFAPGERIIGVQYKKVHFKMFSGDQVEKANLENNRWVMFLGNRGTNQERVDEPALSGDMINASLEESMEVSDLELDDGAYRTTVEDDEFVYLDEDKEE